MGPLPRLAALTLAGALAGAAACGDPLVVAGDFPGVLRIVAGVPDSAGAEVGSTGVETLLSEPQGLAADADELVYIADFGNARILRIRPSGDVEVLLDHSDLRTEPRVHSPTALALDGQGALIIADSPGHRIWRLDLAGGEASPIAGIGVPGSAPDGTVATAAELITPSGVAVATDGRVYFSERDGHRVRRIETDGTLTTVAGTGVAGPGGDGGPAMSARLRGPTGLFLAGQSLYVADSGNNRIRVVDLADGIIRGLAGTGVAGFAGDRGPASEALLDSPGAVAVTSDGERVIVSDSGNHRVRAVNLGTGRISTLAGTGDARFNGDLLAAGETALDAPLGVAVTPLGFLHIADTGHHVVRRTALAVIVVP